MSSEGRIARTTGRESLSDPAYHAFLALYLVAALALARLASRYAPTRHSS
jgi:hypothetical protein